MPVWTGEQLAAGLMRKDMLGWHSGHMMADFVPNLKFRAGFLLEVGKE